MSKIIGIDLGTTNSCVAVLEGGEPVVIANAEGARTTPSVVAFSKTGERMVGQVAKRQAVTNADRTVSSIKRHMGENYKVTIDGKGYTPQEISAMVLQKLKADAESYLGTTVSEAVITVPAYFSDAQRQATKDAGKIAGLDVKRIVNEPTAAALAYGLDKESEQKIMVYDLGGGTFDVSILDIGDGVIEVLATAGDTHLGGDDFDQRIMNYLVEEFKKAEGIDLSADRVAMQRLKEAAEKAKIELSSAMSSQINLPFITADATGPKHLDMTLTRAKFNELTADLVDRTMTPVRKALADAGLRPSDLKKVLMVGGSTRIPAVYDAVKKELNCEPFKGINPDECVAEKAKIELSGMTTTNVNLPYITADATGPKHLDVTISRAKFNELTADLVERTMKPVRQAMSDAGLSAGQLDKVLLVGGSTRIPAVQEAVKGITGKEGFKGINPDECVAVGAAIQGGVLTGDVKDILLLDVTPLSLGIETMGGVFTRLIDRNTTIPTKKSQIFSTAADNQSSVDVHVLQGEREMAAYNKTLGRFQLSGIAPAPRGIPQIEVTVAIDANGSVTVSAKDLGTGKEQNISITASTNLSQDDIDKAVKEAEQFAAEDKARKDEVDTHNAADQTIYQTEKTLADLGDKISAEEKSSIQSAVDHLKEVNKGTDVQAIKDATEAVQKAFYAVSEKLDVQAIKDATEAVQKAYYAVSEKLYQQAGAQAGPNAGANPAGGDHGVVDADSETVD